MPQYLHVVYHKIIQWNHRTIKYYLILRLLYEYDDNIKYKIQAHTKLKIKSMQKNIITIDCKYKLINSILYYNQWYLPSV